MLIWFLIFSCNFALSYLTTFSHFFNQNILRLSKISLALSMNLDKFLFSLNFSCLICRYDGMYFIGSLWVLRQWMAQRNKPICETDYLVILLTVLSLVKISHYHIPHFCKIHLLKSNDLGMETQFSDPRILSPRIF